MSPQNKEHLFCHNLPTTPLKLGGCVLVTGASGYIGGRLVPELLARGYKVRIMVRADSTEYRQRWPTAEVVVADALDYGRLKEALKGVEVAYYLIHSLRLGPSQFESADLEAASNFKRAAHENGVRRIIYLGGLGEFHTTVSRHLQSRLHVAEELVTGEVPVTILRAAVIIGSGSASYEIIHHLVKSLSFLMIPSWSKNKCQPIGIRDVIKYLVGVLETPGTAGASFDIGGQDILSYEEMLKVMADVLHKKMLFLPSPFSNLKLFAYFASLVTPVPAPITISLMEGLKDAVVCRDHDITNFIPFTTLTYREAIVRALTRHEQDMVYTRWSDAYPPAHSLAIKLHELDGEPHYSAAHSILSNKAASSIFNSFCAIGGKNGWFQNNWMWYLRGMVDKVFFGVGSSRGRRSDSRLSVNDVIDFWRVEDIQPNKRLLLRAEMKLPGKAWLEFNIETVGDKRKLEIKAYYYIHSIWGKIYWYIFLPFHQFIFTDLIKQIEARS